MRRGCESPRPVCGCCGGTRWAGPLTQPAEEMLQSHLLPVLQTRERSVLPSVSSISLCSLWVVKVTRLNTFGVRSAGRLFRKDTSQMKEGAAGEDVSVEGEELIVKHIQSGLILHGA